MKRVAFGFLWFVVFWLVGTAVLGAIAGTVSGRAVSSGPGTPFQRGYDSGYEEGHRMGKKYGGFIFLGALCFSIAGTAFGVLPGTKSRQTNLAVEQRQDELVNQGTLSDRSHLQQPLMDKAQKAGQMSDQNPYAAPKSEVFLAPEGEQAKPSVVHRFLLTSVIAFPVFMMFVVLGTKGGWGLGAIGSVMVALMSGIVAIFIPVRRRVLFVLPSLFAGLALAFFIGSTLGK